MKGRFAKVGQRVDVAPARVRRALGQLSITGRIGLGLVGLIVLLTTIAPLITNYGPTTIDVQHVLAAPSSQHWFGTDQRGMDVFSRIIYAPRIDLLIAFTATLLAMAVGIPLGTIAGMYEEYGWVRGSSSQVIMRGMDILQAVPVFVFALAVVAVLGSGSLNVILALGFVNAPVFVRLVRAEVLVWRDRSFVEAAMLSGWSRTRVAFRHVLPNAVGPSVAQASVVLGYSILLTAGLSFVGAGVRPPTAEWGGMISDGAANLATGQWWTALFPGIAIGVTVLAFSLLAESLRGIVAESGLRLRGRGLPPVEDIVGGVAELELDASEVVGR
jgi:peptide/nickel transport system permease protein